MRRAALTVLLTLLAAGQAGAQVQGDATPTARAAGLRGALGEAPRRPPAPPPIQTTPANGPTVLTPEAPPAALAVPQADASQCRLSCAQTYYFCASDDPTGCSQAWGQCVRGCSGLSNGYD